MLERNDCSVLWGKTRLRAEHWWSWRVHCQVCWPWSCSIQSRLYRATCGVLQKNCWTVPKRQLLHIILSTEFSSVLTHWLDLSCDLKFISVLLRSIHVLCKLLAGKKHILLIKTCVYLVLFAGRSIYRFFLKFPDFLHQSPDLRCFEVERSETV